MKLGQDWRSALPFDPRGERQLGPISVSQGLVLMLGALNLIPIPGLGFAIGFAINKLIGKPDYSKEIHIIQNVVRPMMDAMKRGDYIAATGFFRGALNQEPQRTHIQRVAHGVALPGQWHIMKPMQDGLFTAMIGYAMDTGDWEAVRTFVYQLEVFQRQAQQRGDASVTVEVGAGEPVPSSVSSLSPQGVFMATGGMSVQVQLQAENDGSIPDSFIHNGQVYSRLQTDDDDLMTRNYYYVGEAADYFADDGGD